MTMSVLYFQDILESDLHANNQKDFKHTKPEGRERNFFKDLSLKLINDLYELYKKDFLMFGY